MSQSIESEQFVLLQSSTDQDIHTALGIYQNEEDAYAAALIHQMQSIEANTANKIGESQEQLTELCRYIKEDLTSYKQRFEHMTQHLSSIFDHIYHYQILSTGNASAISESIFKTKLRNFLDAFQTRSDIEEDLGNSDDEDEEDDEEEEDIEEAGSDDDSEEEEQLDEEQSEAGEEELEDEEEEEEEDETAVPELEESSDEEEGGGLKRKASDLEEEEEDEIDEEDNDEDELDDDEESNANAHKKRRTAAA